jgi:hypothetical protein
MRYADGYNIYMKYIHDASNKKNGSPITMKSM